MIEKVVNLDILLNPINWLIVITVLVFASYSAYVLWSNASWR